MNNATSKSTTLPAAVMWDLDGTLINSEPYWGESERALLDRAGGTWTPDIAAQLQGSSLAFVANFMIQAGVKDMSAEDIARFMVEFVYKKEVERLPWLPGVYDLITAVRDAGIPQIIVTSSPEKMARNVKEQAPEGAFMAYVCDNDDVPHKPSPEPYLLAARTMGVDIKDCLIFEDSVPGLTAAAASGASWVSVTGYSSIDARERGLASQFVRDYEGLGIDDIARFFAHKG